ELFAEAAERGKRLPPAEDEGTGGPAGRAAERIPGPDGDAESRRAFGCDGTAAGQHIAALDDIPQILEQTRRRRGIRVDEQQPFPRGSLRAPVARAGDLVVRLEHHLRPRRPRDLGGAVGGIVVADDELPGPGAIEAARRAADAAERRGEQALLVERRYDDRELQARCFLKCATVRSHDSFAAASL